MAAQKVGLLDRRNMVWSWSPDEPRNFGDWIGPLIFTLRRGHPPLNFRLKPASGRGRAYVTAGSIMGHIRRSEAAIVWGAGIIARDQAFERPRQICAVRGPITRARCLELGYDCPEVFGDPAILLPRLFGAPSVAPRRLLGIVPHFVNYAEALDRFAADERVKVVDVGRPVDEVVEDILSCEVLVSSSLHGLIVSHAYGRPAARVTFSAPLKGDGVKFADYYLGCGVEPPAPFVVDADTSVDDLVRLARKAPCPRTGSLDDDLLAACPF